MHVLHLNLGFARVVDAGTFLDGVPVLTRLCEETVRLGGHRVTVLGRFSRDGDLSRGGVDYHFRADDPRHLLAGRRTRPTALYRLARRLAPDVIHLHGVLFPIQTAELRAWVGRRPVVVVQHHGERPEGRMRPWLQRLLYRFADGFLFTAGGIAEEWRHAGVLDPAWPVLDVVEASTDFEPVPRAEARVQTPLPGSPAVLWVGRLHEKKDPLTALAGFAASLTELPGAHLTMVFREAPLRPAVEAFVARSPALAGRVHLAGEVPHAELPSYLSAADLFVTTSPAEGSNFALLEALACGTFPVASDIPAHRALTTNGAVGSLFPVGDRDALARELVAAARGVTDALRCETRRHFESRLSWAAVARQAVAAYETLLDGKRRQR